MFSFLKSNFVSNILKDVAHAFLFFFSIRVNLEIDGTFYAIFVAFLIAEPSVSIKSVSHKKKLAWAPCHHVKHLNKQDRHCKSIDSELPMFSNTRSETSPGGRKH